MTRMRGDLKRRAQMGNPKGQGADAWWRAPYCVASLVLFAAVVSWVAYVNAQGCMPGQTCSGATCPAPCNYTVNQCKDATGTCTCTNPPANFSFNAVQITNLQAGMFCHDADSGSCTQAANANCYTITYYYSENPFSGCAAGNAVCTSTVQQPTCTSDHS